MDITLLRQIIIGNGYYPFALDNISNRHYLNFFLYQNYGDDELYIRIILYFIALLDSCDIRYVTIKFNNHPLISIIS